MSFKTQRSEGHLASANRGAKISISRLQDVLGIFKTRSLNEASTPRRALPQISEARQSASFEQEDTKDGGEHTVLYLAYGSNLCYETFQGKRGIRPIAQLNVVVPTLRMTFDLPGIPYTEPCFANSATRDPSPEYTQDYHKDHWKKGMVGVVYEVTHADYAHIIATEGGGASYHDIEVDCYPLVDGEKSVPEFPKTVAFKTHTLFTPASSPDEGGRFQRPDPSYAQPSARYLKLITDGAAEHDFPRDYTEYLHALRPYECRSQKQRMGQFVSEMLWMPFLLLLFALNRQYQDEEGKVPNWLAGFGAQIFGAIWITYDGMFKPLFGDGERTDYKHKDDEEWGEKH